MDRAHLPGILAVACGATACGGGAATLYPAHTLGPNQVSAGAGVSENFAFDVGTPTPSTPPGAGGNAVDPEQAFVNQTMRNALLAPGLAPWIGARVGIGGSNEAGFTYTGRSVRLDARHAFSNDEFALSVGLGASGVLVHPGSYNPPPAGSPLVLGRFTDQTAELSGTGFGFELPVIAGWRSSGSVVSIWGGARAGAERVRGEMPMSTSATPPPGGQELPTLFADLSGTRLWAGGLVGFAIGVRPIWVAVELDAAYQAMSTSTSFPAGTPTELESKLSGVTLAPTGAVIGKFW